MLKLILVAAMTASEPTLPQEHPWPGGPWTGDGADKGKIYPAGAFKYIKKEEYAVYQKEYTAWEKKYLSLILQRQVKNNPIKFEFYNLASVLPTMHWTLKGESIVATAPLSAYGGSGTVTATVSKTDRKIEITIKNANMEKYIAEIGINSPIRVTGTIGLLSGTIVNDKAYFTGTDIRASTNALLKVDLTADLRTGAFTAGADTTLFGKQYIPGKLRLTK